MSQAGFGAEKFGMNKAKRSAKQQRPDVHRRGAIELKGWSSRTRSYSAQLLTAAGRCKKNCHFVAHSLNLTQEPGTVKNKDIE